VTERMLRLAQRMLVGREDVLARRWQARLMDSARRERLVFERSLTTSPGPGRVVIASYLGKGGDWTWLGMPGGRLVTLRAAVAGATNSGKSSWLLGVLAQVLLEDRYPVILFDAKGETVDAVLDLLLPFLLESGLDRGALDRLRVVRVFGPDIPLLNLTRPEPGVPKEAQAYAVASAIEQVLAEPLGGRMHHVLVRFVALLIELGLPLTTIQPWLEDPAAFGRAASRSSDVSMREYARAGFRQENKESLRALASRLNALLFWPDARLALCAPGTVSFAEALTQPGLTVIHTGSPPAGAERLARFFSAVLVGQVVRALLSRKVEEQTPPALFVAEEIQEALGAEEARQLGRLLATARFKRAAVWLTNQSRSQLHAVDPGLVSAIRTNVELLLQFRCSPEDATAFAHLLPKEREGEAARRELVESLTRLPQRHCYLAVRDLGLKAQPVVAPRIDFDALRESGHRVSPELRQRIQRGIVALSREQLPGQQATPDTPASTQDPDDGQTELPPESDEFPGLG